MNRLWPERIEVRALTSGDAGQIARWRYEGRWRIYDIGDVLLRADDGYFAVAGADDGRLIGYCCHGAEARVPGLDEEPGLLDVGLGMDPDWVGQGHGLAFGNAVVDFLRTRAAGRGLRAVVQSWNIRSLRLTHRLGFVETATHNCVQGGATVPYRIVIREAEH